MAGQSDKPSKPRTARSNSGCPKGQAALPQPHGGAIGRAPYVPTQDGRDLVVQWAYIKGCEWTARELGIGPATLNRHFAEELKLSKLIAQSEAAAKLHQKAIVEGDGATLRLYAACIDPERWSPKIKHSHGGERGSVAIAVEVDFTVFLRGKSNDELAAIEQVASALLAAGVAVPANGGGTTSRADKETES